MNVISSRGHVGLQQDVSLLRVSDVKQGRMKWVEQPVQPPVSASVVFWWIPINGHKCCSWLLFQSGGEREKTPSSLQVEHVRPVGGINVGQDHLAKHGLP